MICHPGTKIPFYLNEIPLDMLGELIYLFTPHGGSFLDLFCGMMTTLVAAQKIRRDGLGIEKISRATMRHWTDSSDISYQGPMPRHALLRMPMSHSIQSYVKQSFY